MLSEWPLFRYMRCIILLSLRRGNQRVPPWQPEKGTVRERPRGEAGLATFSTYFWGQTCAEEYPTPVGKHGDSEGTSAWNTVGSKVGALPWEKQQLHPEDKDQLCLRQFPAAVAAPSILTVPKLPLMARCPHHTQHQGELLACHVMTHYGARGGKHALIPLVGQRSLLSSLSGTAVLRHNLAKPWLWNLQHCWAGLWSAFCSIKERFPLVSLLQPCLAPVSAWAQPGGTGDVHPGKGRTPFSRCVVRDRMAWDRKCVEKAGRWLRHAPTEAWL